MSYHFFDIYIPMFMKGDKKPSPGRGGLSSQNELGGQNYFINFLYTYMFARITNGHATKKPTNSNTTPATSKRADRILNKKSCQAKPFVIAQLFFKAEIGPFFLSTIIFIVNINLTQSHTFNTPNKINKIIKIRGEDSLSRTPSIVRKATNNITNDKTHNQRNCKTAYFQILAASENKSTTFAFCLFNVFIAIFKKPSVIKGVTTKKLINIKGTDDNEHVLPPKLENMSIIANPSNVVPEKNQKFFFTVSQPNLNASPFENFLTDFFAAFLTAFFAFAIVCTFLSGIA